MFTGPANAATALPLLMIELKHKQTGEVLMVASLPCAAIPILAVLHLFIHHRLRIKRYGAAEFDIKPEEVPEDRDGHGGAN